MLWHFFITGPSPFKDTNGERVILKAIIKSKGQLVPNHFHVFQDETFEVLSGDLTVLLNGETKKISAGETMDHVKKYGD